MTAAIALALAFAVPSAGVDILFPARVRVAVTVDGKNPEAAWTKFLDTLFDHFDRNGDNALSAAEAARVFPLPLPGGAVAMDFAKLGKGTRAEFRAFYRSAGFAPVVATVRPPTAEQRKLSDALFRHLDRDGNGTLSQTELKDAPALFRRLDENEDEILDRTELLANAPELPKDAARSAVRVAASTGAANVLVRVNVGKDTKPQPLAIPSGSATVQANSTANGFATAKEFFLAQFAEAAGGKKALTKADAEADSALQALAGMFDAADRDGDGNLTAAELKGFLDLLAQGIACQVLVTVEDNGASLFDLLDANGDGRLDLAELTRAAKMDPLKKASLPNRYRVIASRGPVAPTFGPVAVPSPSFKAAAPPSVKLAGPKWFRAMDRNGDGFVSADEFRGPPELFAKLDLDGDGRISAEEAERHGQ